MRASGRWPENRARILKDFQMTAGLKVWFHLISRLLIKSADIFNVKCKCSVILSNFLFFQTVNTKKSLKCKKIVATVSPAVHSDLWKDGSLRKVDFSASSKCFRIRAQDAVILGHWLLTYTVKTTFYFRWWGLKPFWKFQLPPPFRGVMLLWWCIRSVILWAAT
jgi:hypothetical protein